MYTRETYSSFPRTSISTRSKTNSVWKSSANKSKPTTRPAKGTTNLKSREWKFVAEAVLKMTRRLFCAVTRSPLPRKRDKSRRRRQQEDQSFPAAAEAFREVYIPNVATRSDANLNAQSNITLCFDLVPSANQFMASKPKITNTTNNSINVKRMHRSNFRSTFAISI